MTPEAVEVARALVAAPWWEWREGMRVIGTRPLSSEPRFGRLNRRDGGHVVAWDDGSYWSPSDDDLASWIPDLDDPATAGVLLSMLTPGWWAAQLLSGAYTMVPDRYAPARGLTLGVAVARALLAVRGGA